MDWKLFNNNLVEFAISAQLSRTNADNQLEAGSFPGEFPQLHYLYLQE